MLATYTVNSVGDAVDGDRDDGICDTGNAIIGFTDECTLRAAIRTANERDGLDRIHFDIPVSVIPTINLSSGSGARTFTDQIVVDGTTQSAGMVEINGSIEVTGLTLSTGSSGSEIRGLIINRLSETAIFISSDNNLVAGNYIGTDVTGKITDPDGIPRNGDEFGNGGTGVSITGKGNVVGGTDPADRNVISGNATGVGIGGNSEGGNRVLGNYIGVDVDGKNALFPGLGLGVRIAVPSIGNRIGSTEPGGGNIIAGGFAGIQILSDDNFVAGNTIGSDIDGIVDVGHAKYGIQIFGSRNVVGGDFAAARNIIVGNDIGIDVQLGAENVIENNSIGVNSLGAAVGNNQGVVINGSRGNRIGGAIGNVISGNEFDGVIIGQFTAFSNVVLGNHRMRRKPKHSRAGLTLIEVVISTLLVGVLLVGAMNCVGAVIRGRLGTGDSIKAKQLASQLIAEIQPHEYLEPTDPPSFGIEIAESAVVRTAWDDVDDYHLWSASPPQDRNGVPATNLTGWQRDVVVEWADPSNPSLTVGSDQGVKRVTVTVRRNGQIVAQEVAIRSDKYSAD